jgi:hypothetical protein
MTENLIIVIGGLIVFLSILVAAEFVAKYFDWE